MPDGSVCAGELRVADSLSTISCDHSNFLGWSRELFDFPLRVFTIWIQSRAVHIRSR
jgi:hypothetical protein